MPDVTLKSLPIIPPVIPEDVEALTVSTLLSDWEEIVRDYEAAPGDVGHAFLYVAQHPAFWEIHEGTDVDYYLKTGAAWYRAVELGVWREARTDTPLVWMEATACRWWTDPALEDVQKANPQHAEVLGVALETYEQSLTVLAKQIHKQWGNDREFMRLPEEDPEGR